MLKKLLRLVAENKKETLLLLGILAMGAFLRLYRIADYMTFLGDEGRDVLVAKRMIVDHKFTLLGPTASVGGFFLGPIYYYFMLPFLWIFRFDPVGPAVMVALFGVATIFLVYKMGKDFFNAKAGLMAASLYAVSPLVIAYSRSSWNPNLMPFFSLLTLFTLHKGLIRKSAWLLAASGIFLGVSLQLHYLATFLAVIMVVYLFLMGAKTPKILVKHYILLISGFLLGLSPFLAFEVRHGFPNTQTIFRFIFSGAGEETGFVGENFFGVIGTLLFRLFWRLLTRFPPLSQITISENLTYTLWYWGMVVLVFASLGVFFFWGLKAWRQKSSDWPKFTLLFLWLSLGIGLFTFYQKPIYDYYLGFMFPLPFILVGSFLSSLYANLSEFVRYIVSFFSKKFTLSPSKGGRREFMRIKIVGKIVAIVVFSILIWGNLEGMPFRYSPNRQLEQTKQIAHFVLEKTEGKPFNFALLAGQNSDHAYRYFLEIWGAKPVTVEYAGVDPERKTVTDQLLVVCEGLPCQPLGHSLWEIAGFGQAEIVGEWQVSVVKIYKLVHYRESL